MDQPFRLECYAEAFAMGRTINEFLEAVGSMDDLIEHMEARRILTPEK